MAGPGVHRRHILKIAGGVWLVRDVAATQESTHAEHELEIRWHFAPDLDVRKAGAGRVEVSQGVPASDKCGLILIMPDETAWHTEASRTLISPAYGTYQPAPFVRCHARVPLPAETATVLAPRPAVMRQDHEPIVRPRLVSIAHAALQVYELRYHAG